MSLAAMPPSLEAWGVVAAFAVMVASNTLSQKRAFGGKDNKQISDEHPTYLSPDGPTFAIWGFIYLFELVLVVAQVLASARDEGLLARRCPLTGLNVRERLMLCFTANAVWLPVFNNERFWAALGVMAVYLGLLLSIYQDLNVTNATGVMQALTFTVGISMNTSWILVASMVSAFFCGGLAGWRDQFGVAGSVSAGILGVLLVAALGCERALRGGDLAWAFVAAWASRGIYRMQTVPDRVRFPLGAMNKNLAAVARFASLVVGVAWVAEVGLCVYRRVMPKTAV